MEVWTDVDHVPPEFGPSVVTIGNFDGVHRGHRDVLRRLVLDARQSDLRAVAVTFDPHPSRIHRPDTAPPVLTGLADRLALLAQTGLDAVLVLTYTYEFADLTPEDFVRRYLVEALGAVTVVVGRDVRFGRSNAGDLATMVELGGRLGFRVEVIDDVAGHPDPHAAGHPITHRRWSSTWARELLEQGDVAAAAVVLDRPHRIRGEVVRGDARGHKLGFPTANLGPEILGMVPADGVYAGWLLRHGGRGDPLPAAVSIGTNPTFGGVGRRVEAHVLGRDDLDLYGEEVVLDFVRRIRPTVRFDDVDELVVRMREDVADVAAVLDAAGVPAPAPAP